MSTKKEKLIRSYVGELPIIRHIVNQLGLREILSRHIKSHANETIPAADTVMMLLYNITCERRPLYELKEWSGRVDPGVFGDLSVPLGGTMNDDRFGRALDKLYWADRATLMTDIVMKMVESTRLELSRIHNDSTTLKAYGEIPGTTRTGLNLAKGNSKDHRPDLKQLVYTLTISADGAVPIHYKTYSGNRTDDTTHIETKFEHFSSYNGNYFTQKGHYRIHWIFSTEKKKRDKISREHILQKTEHDLSVLSGKLNTRKLKSKKEIQNRLDLIFKQHGTKAFFHASLSTIRETNKIQIGKGRPGPKTKYKTVNRSMYALTYVRNQKKLAEEQNVDGIFPLLTTDEKLGAKETLDAYKYQPRLEKRFTQFKSVHKGAPLLFKSIQRVEAIMFLFFLALMIQAVLERMVRNTMHVKKVESLPVYPEHRIAYHPTTAKIFERFEGVSVYKLMQGKDEKIIRDELTFVQDELLDIIGISKKEYWS